MSQLELFDVSALGSAYPFGDVRSPADRLFSRYMAALRDMEPAVVAAPVEALTTRLLIMPCGATKAPGDILPAGQRYAGPLWQSLRAADPDGSRAALCVLSAKHGLVSGGELVKRYDQKMTEARAAELISGGIHQRQGWHERSYDRERCGVTAAAAVSHARMAARCRQFDSVCIVGGGLYVDVAKSYVLALVAEGTIASDASVTVINGAIGCMRRDLVAWINQGEG